MPPSIAAFVFCVGIAGLFWLDRDQEHLTSKGLWIPLIWFSIAGSRPISVWLGVAPPPTQTDPYLEGSPLDRNVYIVLLLAGLFILILRQSKVSKILAANVFVLVYLFYGAVSVTWSDYTEIGFKRWIKAVGDLVMVLIVLTDAEPLVALKRIFARMGFLFLPLSVLFIRYYPALGRSYNRWTWEPFFTGVATNKNMLGMTTLICGLAAVWRFSELLRCKIAPDRRRHLIAQGVLVLNAIYLLFVAHSATSMSCFYLGAALILAAGLPRFVRKPGGLHFLTAGMIFLAAFPLFLGTNSSLLQLLGRDPTLTGRTEIWREILKKVSNPMIGTGYGTFWLGERITSLRHIFEGNDLMESHNGYVEAYVNLGWIGVILLLIIIVVGYRSVFFALRQRVEDASLRLAFVVTALIYNFTEAAFKELNPVWIFFLYAVITIPTTQTPERPIPARLRYAKKKLRETGILATR